MAPRLLEHLGEPLSLVAVHLYERRAGGKLALAKRGAHGETGSSDTVGAPTESGASAASGPERPDISDELSARLGAAGEHGVVELPWVGETAAGLTGLFGVGGADGPVIALFPAHGDSSHAMLTPGELLSALNSLVYAVRQRLERRRLEDVLEQARTIQLSLLPPGRHDFMGFDVYARSVPASSVGGDLYDYHDVDADTLGIAVADAAGHGLPAALQARDVATGLRMGVERDLKITRTIEKLNRVIHRSGLSSRFISLVFAELERNGNLSYVNAGHPPALLLDERGVRELSVGGMIVGPDPEARYKLGFVHVDRGASLVLCTDGVIERANERDELFGLEGLAAWLKEWASGPSQDAIEDLFRRLAEFGGGTPFEDDVTAMLVRRD